MTRPRSSRSHSSRSADNGTARPPFSGINSDSELIKGCAILIVAVALIRLGTRTERVQRIEGEWLRLVTLGDCAGGLSLLSCLSDCARGETGKRWIEAVRRALAESEWVQITSIEWHERTDGVHDLRVVTPQGSLSECFTKADLDKIPADDDARAAVEIRLATLIAGGYDK